MTKKKTVRTFRKMKKNAEKIVMITAYDAPTAAIAQAADIDLILIGDSVGTTMLGYDDTVPVTMDDMIHHCKQVRRGAPDMFLVGDMPFLSYHCGDDDAMRNAGRFLQEAACDCVKLESSRDTLPLIKRMVAAGIPVMAHIGLLPQRIQAVGGYQVTGRGDDAQRLLADAKAFEEAGAFGIVLECVSRDAAKMITDSIAIPTIGIGSGPECDGQVQVFHDIIGMFDGFTPKHSRRYAEAGKLITDALASYARDVREGTFPADENCF